MAKFSFGRDDGDADEPCCSRRKKPRTTVTPPPPSETTVDQQIIEVEEEDEEEEEHEGAEVDSESEEDEESPESGDEELEDVVVLGQTNSAEPTLVKEDGASVDQARDGSISVTLTDPDVLDCPICLEILTIPVFQCENGHVACSACCMKLKNKCPSCSWPIGYNRCRAIERVIESIKTSCENMKYGCKEMVSYNKKLEHEVACVYAPCACPLSGCAFVGSSKQLSVHFRLKHSGSTKLFTYGQLFQVSLQKELKNVILQEKTDGTIFAIVNVSERLGNLVSVAAIGPTSSTEFFYNVMATKDGSVVRMRSHTENVTNLDGNVAVKRFLMVPCDFVSASGEMKLDICVWKGNGDAAARVLP